MPVTRTEIVTPPAMMPMVLCMVNRTSQRRHEQAKSGSPTKKPRQQRLQERQSSEAGLAQRNALPPLYLRRKYRFTPVENGAATR